MGLAAGTRLGPYEIVAPLGAGGMGEVYRARDARLGRDVAIKVLPPDVAQDADRRARFEREARAVAALSHPNILALYDIGVDRRSNSSSSRNCSRARPLRRAPRRRRACRFARRVEIAVADRARARGRARQRHRAPGSEAGQRLPARRWAREDSRLRPRASGRTPDDQARNADTDATRQIRAPFWAPPATWRRNRFADSRWMGVPISSRSASCSTRWSPGSSAFAARVDRRDAQCDPEGGSAGARRRSAPICRRRSIGSCATAWRKIRRNGFSQHTT